MMVLEINPQNPQRRLIRRAAEVLGNGGIIAYPTDSYYGIGTAATVNSSDTNLLVPAQFHT